MPGQPVIHSLEAAEGKRNKALQSVMSKPAQRIIIHIKKVGILKGNKVIIYLVFQIGIIEKIITVFQGQKHFCSKGNLMITQNITKRKIRHSSGAKDITDLKISTDEIQCKPCLVGFWNIMPIHFCRIHRDQFRHLGFLQG